MKMKTVKRNAERIAQQTIREASRAVKSSVKTLKKAEKTGSMVTWKNRLGLALQLVEVAMLATAAAKGLKMGRAAKERPRRARSAAKRAKR
jgi:hypothetical protein